MQDKEKIVINDHIQGEPLSEENLDKTLDFLFEIRLLLPEKTIWLYSGYEWSDIFDGIFCQGLNNYEKQNQLRLKRKEIISICDIFVDGRYIDSQRNISKKWAGSDNQRVIDVRKSLEQNKIVLRCD